MTSPTEEEVLGYFDTLSNWGRWGEDDQMGTLNHITPEKTKQAVGLVEEGVTVCCSRPITYETTPDQSPPPLHYMIESGEGWASGDKVSATPNSTSKDFIGMAFHGHTITHIDSLAHIFWGGKMYKRSAGAPGVDQPGRNGRVRGPGQGQHRHPGCAG